MFMQIPNFVNIIPVKDKKPLIPWQEYSRSGQNSEEKAKILKLCANGNNTGIVTGKVSGIIVLDDDGGLDYEKYKVPKTWTVQTPRGGRHYYFKWTKELNNKVTTKVGICEKVDVRGEGGFVVFYGFKSPYFTTPLAPPPQWLVDLLPDKGTQSTLNSVEDKHKSKLQEILNDIKPGNRNDSFIRIAGSLRSRGYSSSEIYSFLESKAREVNFDLTELSILTESVGRYSPKIQVDDTQASSIEEFLKDQEKVEWICEGMIAKKSIGFIVGLPETKKTWILIDLAIECAKGGVWLGKFPVNKIKVLFIDQERFKGETQRRFRAVLTGSNVPLNVISPNLHIRSGTTTRLNLQHSFDAFRKEIAELKPDLVIVDSFVSFHTSEENNRQSIQEVLEKVKELRNEFGCTFLFIHHENKNAFDKEAGEPSISQMAGSIAIPAVAETVFTVRKQDSESSMVYNTKNTLASTVSPFLVKVTDMDDTKTKIKVEAF